MTHDTTSPILPDNVPHSASGKNLYIHGLRGYLALSVFFFHVANSQLPTFHGGLFDVINTVLLSMEHNVEIFFGISGIVIFFAYQSSKSIVSFWVNRMTRIYPVLWVTTIIVFILYCLRGDLKWQMPDSLVLLAANFLALTPLVQMKLIHPAAWSLCYEFFFYFLFVAFGVLRRGISHGVVLAIIMIPALIFFEHAPRAWMFFPGCMIAFLVANGKLNKSYLQAPGLLIFLAILAWYFAFASAEEHGYPHPSLFEFAVAPAPMALFIAGCALGAVGLAGIFMGNGWMAKWLLHPICQWLGTISYSLYLWQAVTMAIIKYLMNKFGIVTAAGDWSQLVFFVLALPPTLMISHWSQVLLEVRFTKALRKMVSKHSNPVPVTAEKA